MAKLASYWGNCHIDDLCINHVFYADDLRLIAPCAIALQELINLSYDYSIEIDMNFNALKSYCIAFTPKLYKLTLPSLHINSLSISYTDSINPIWAGGGIYAHAPSLDFSLY